MIKILLIIGIVFISEFITYKAIKFIDKKERKKLYNWELNYIQEIEKLKKQLVEEKKKGTKKDVCTSNSSSSDNNKDILESTSSGENNLQATK